MIMSEAQTSQRMMAHSIDGLSLECLRPSFTGQQELAGPELLARTAAEAPAAAGGGFSSSKWVVPPAAVVEAFWSSSEAGREMKELLAKPFDKADSHPAALVRSRYALSPMEALAVVVRRQLQLVLKDTTLIKGRIIQVVVMGLICGSLFLQLDHTISDSRSFFAVSFLSVMFM
ncbi:Pleiotropic drug resistance protein TUR2, partial [Tetrabaena socialis]